MQRCKKPCYEETYFITGDFQIIKKFFDILYLTLENCGMYSFKNSNIQLQNILKYNRSDKLRSIVIPYETHICSSY